MNLRRFDVADVTRVDDFASPQALADFARYRSAVLDTIDALGIPRADGSDDPTVFGSSSHAIWEIDSRNPLPSPDKSTDLDIIIADEDTKFDLGRRFGGWDKVRFFEDRRTRVLEIHGRPGLAMPVDIVWSPDSAVLRNMAGYDGDAPPSRSRELDLTVVNYLLTGSNKAMDQRAKGPASAIRAHAVGYHTENNALTEDPLWQAIVGAAMARLIAGVPDWLGRKWGSDYPAWLGNLVAGGFATHPAFRDIEPVLLKRS